MTDKPKCPELVVSGTGWPSHPCGAKGKLFEDGKWWCGRHAPSAKKARDAASRERWARERAEEEAQRERRKVAAFEAELRRRVAAMEAKPVNFWPEPDAAVYVGEVLVSRAALLRALGVEAPA